MKYFSMFSGIGGFELGIIKAFQHIKEQSRDRNSVSSNGNCSNNEREPWKDYSCVGYSEINKYAIQIYEKHFGGTNYGDATKIEPDKLPDFDLLCGGFPCQAFSIAGKRRGFEDTRGTLFFDVARIIKTKRPKIILLENVKGLLSHNKGETFRVIIQSLDELGYFVEWQVLNSKDYGVPQNRERVFIIGHLRGEPFKQVFPIRKVYKSNIESRKIFSSATISTRTGSTAGGQQFIKDILTPDRAEKIRRLTPIECERLQGFPDNWTEGLSDSQRYKCLGNAVTVNVIEEIICSLNK